MGNPTLPSDQRKHFIRDGMQVGHRGEYYEVKEQQYLGGDEFVEILHRHTRRFGLKAKAKGEALASPLDR